jgi:RNA polymerase sigma factor (sigma-70 family)
VSADFPSTRHTLLTAARSDDPSIRRRGFDALIAAYWKPVYKYLRIKWRASEADAEDLTQEFFARAMEKGFFDRYELEKSRFRTFLRVCLDRFVANQRKGERRLKRGGQLTFVPLDFQDAEGELRRLDVPDDLDLDEFFQREWVRSLFGVAVDALRARCAAAGRTTDFELFQRYDLEEDAASRPTYKQMAEAFGMSPAEVTNRLSRARREFRAAVLDHLRAISGSEEEFRQEARQLLGIDAP